MDRHSTRECCRSPKFQQDCPKQSELSPSRHRLWQTHLIAAAHNSLNVFATWRQYARPSNTRFRGPAPVSTPNGSSICLGVFARSMPYSPYAYTCALRRPILHPSKTPLPVGGSGSVNPHSIYGSLDPPVPQLKTVSRSNQPFFHSTRSLPTVRRTERTRKSTCTNRPLTLYLTERLSQKLQPRMLMFDTVEKQQPN